MSRTAGVVFLAMTTLACGTSSSLSSSAPPPAENAALAPGSEWPMYSHDTGHTNTNLQETAISAGGVNALAPIFQVNIGFNGSFGSNSTPVVSNGRVYVGGSAPSGSDFFAFDAATGRALWAADLGHTSSDPCGPVLSVGIPSTAAVSGNTLVVGGGDAAYYGVDTQAGSVVWRVPLNVGGSGFAWASPLINGSAAYWGASSQCDNPSVRGQLQAVNFATGQPAGVQFFAPPDGQGGGVWNSPALTPDGAHLVVATGEDTFDHYPYEQAFLLLDPTTLQIQAADKVPPVGGDQDFGNSPVVFHDGTGRLMGTSTLKTGTLYAYYLDSLSSGPAWSRAVGSIVGATSAYDSSFGSAGTLFVVGTSGGGTYTGANAVLHALDPATGKDVWPAAVLIGNVANNLAIANRLIFINTGATGLNILDETTGALLRNLSPANAGPAVSGVAVAEGKIYWVSGSWLNVWGPPNP